MSNNKRIAKNTVFLYIRMAFSMIVSLYTVRVVLRVLGVEDYGIYSAVGGIVSSLTIFTNTLAVASQRFFSIEIGKCNKEGLNRVFSSITLLYILAGIIILIITETIGVWFFNNKMVIPLDRMDAAFVILQCTVISFFISIVIAPFQAIIIAKEDMKIYAFVGVYDVIVKLLIVFLLQLFELDKLILYGLLLLIASASSQCIYLLFTLKKYKDIKFRLNWYGDTMKSVLSFSVWSFIGCLAFLSNAQGLNLLMNVYFGPVVNAAYSIGCSVKNAVNQLGTNFFVAVRPNLIKEYAANNFDYVKKLFFFSTKVIFCLLFMIIFPISVEAEGILFLWLGEVGEYMVSFVRLMLIWALLLNISEPITAIVQAANKVKSYHLKVDLFTLLTLPIVYLAFKSGATPAWAFIISVIVLFLAHILRLYILRKIINIGVLEYFVNIVLRILFSICISLVISSIVRSVISSESLVILFGRVLLEIIIAVGSSYLIVLNTDERGRINELIRTVCGRFKKHKIV